MTTGYYLCKTCGDLWPDSENEDKACKCVADPKKEDVLVEEIVPISITKYSRQDGTHVCGACMFLEYYPEDDVSPAEYRCMYTSSVLSVGSRTSLGNFVAAEPPIPNAECPLSIPQ